MRRTKRRTRRPLRENSLAMGLNIAEDAAAELAAQIDVLLSQRPASANESELQDFESLVMEILDGIHMAKNTPVR